MYFLGQNVKLTYGSRDDKVSLGVLLGKGILTPTGSDETGLWYKVLIKDEEAKGKPTPYLFKEDCLSYVYDKGGKVMFGKTRTKTLCTMDADILDVTDSHEKELERINSEKVLEINEIKH